MLADEPAANLDPVLSEEVMRTLLPEPLEQPVVTAHGVPEDRFGLGFGVDWALRVSNGIRYDRIITVLLQLKGARGSVYPLN